MFISSVDLDSYPFHNILLRIQKDTNIDIPWVLIQTGKLRYFAVRTLVTSVLKKKKKLKWNKKRNTEWSTTREFV